MSTSFEDILRWSGKKILYETQLLLQIKKKYRYLHVMNMHEIHIILHN